MKTEGNIPGIGRENSYYCIYCPGMLKTYQGATKVFEFLRNANREETKRQTSFFNDLTLQCIRLAMAQRYSGMRMLCSF